MKKENEKEIIKFPKDAKTWEDADNWIKKLSNKEIINILIAVERLKDYGFEPNMRDNFVFGLMKSTLKIRNDKGGVQQ